MESLLRPTRLASALAVAVGLGLLLPTQARAQQETISACYVPDVGAIYLIGEQGLPSECLEDSHVEVSWSEGVGVTDHGNLEGLGDDDHPAYVREGESAGGDLGGSYPDPNVVGLQGNAVGDVDPSDGEFLGWDGSASEWVPMAPPSGGGGTSDHGQLNGLTDDDHPQYLHRDGRRAMTGDLDVGGNKIVGLGQATSAGEAVRFEQAVLDGDAAGGDLADTYPDPEVAGLRGITISTSGPSDGEVLTFDASANQWEPASVSGGGGVTDHGNLSGLGDDDHTQYLLAEGVRQVTDGFAVSGSFGTGAIPTSGAGTRLMWHPAKAAFRAGEVDGAQWDNGNIGAHSVAFGRNTTASGDRAFAAGDETTVAAGTNAATAMGFKTTAGASVSTAMGSGTLADGATSTAMGVNTEALGNFSTAMGVRSTARGEASTAMGSGTTASGVNATALGGSTTASGDSSTAMGAGTVARGENSTAMGRATEASGNNSTAMGNQTTASGESSTAMGFGSSATELDAIAMGCNARAIHDNTFVWADGFTAVGTLCAGFESTAPDQFLVAASNGVGINTNSPETSLDVSRGTSGTANTGNHVAFFHNTASNQGDVLMLQSDASSPDAEENFITFKGASSIIGRIEGNGQGQLSLNSGGKDFAEMLPRRRPSESIETGEVVGIVDGEVTKRTTGADQVSVVTDRAIVVGNDPGRGERADYEQVSFLGQVPVKTVGPVEKGDLLVASGKEDGTARAVAPSEYEPQADGPVVGKAWESSSGGTERVNALIGSAAETAALRSVTERQQNRINEQQKLIEKQRKRIEEQGERLDRLEATVERLVESETAENNDEDGGSRQ